MESRVATLEANQSHIMRELHEVKNDTKEIRKEIKAIEDLLRGYIATSNSTFAKKEEVKDLDRRVTSQETKVWYASGFLAAIILGAEYVFKFFR